MSQEVPGISDWVLHRLQKTFGGFIFALTSLKTTHSDKMRWAVCSCLDLVMVFNVCRSVCFCLSIPTFSAIFQPCKDS